MTRREFIGASAVRHGDDSRAESVTLESLGGILLGRDR
jgi:hypothetical protein